jgi:hypothetical protein
MLNKFLAEVSIFKHQLVIQRSYTRNQKNLIKVLQESKQEQICIRLNTEMVRSSILQIHKQDLLGALLIHIYFDYEVENKRNGVEKSGGVLVDLYQPMTKVQSIELFLNPEDEEKLRKSVPEKPLSPIEIRWGKFAKWIQFTFRKKEIKKPN